MHSILPIIQMADLQRRARQVLSELEDYAVIRSHGRDRAFILRPEFGKILLETGMLEVIRKKYREGERGKKQSGDVDDARAITRELKKLIGPVLRELSKK